MKVFINGQYSENVNIENLKSSVYKALDVSLPICSLIKVIDKFSRSLESLNIDDDLKKEISNFCSKSELEHKLVSELGSVEPFNVVKRSFKEDEMESYYPLGTLLHITSSNSEGLSFLALVEGLLSCNTNILKLSRRDSDLCFQLVEHLVSFDSSGLLKSKIIILQGHDIDLSELIELSDGISCWGGDSALNTIKELVPSSKRFITWGHKISFSLIDLSKDLERKAELLKNEIIDNDQQACSAPQVCYILDAKFKDLKEFSKLLNQKFEESNSFENLQLDIQQKAELTNYNQLLKLESLIENKEVIVGKNHQWRIYIEDDSSFKPSPLNRTIWIKPIRSDEISSTFKQHRDYLQTVGVSIDPSRVDVISSLLNSGVTRVRDLGRMQESYSGEPHDGEYALRRFVKKVSVDLEFLKDNFRLDERIEKKQNIDKSLKVMSKEDFQNLDIDKSFNHLFFRSGGSSGKPAISPFSYNSYHVQMSAAAEGLLAAGLNPKTDRCANLFFGGGLYGGFISFFTILEIMEAIQFPLAAYEDKEFVAKTIVEHKVDTILGMPSYIMDLFSEQASILKNSSVKKIFFGGEHFPNAQRETLKNEFNIESIMSASYGSVDAGPLGFQCPHCVGSEHHLNESIQQLEILDLERDEAVTDGEVGRLVFTSKARDTISINRYDLGDLGRIISGDCECGRKNLKFELLGRYGDIFRAGGTFYNYTKIQRILSENFSYEDIVQITISNTDGKDHIDMRLKNKEIDNDYFISLYKDLHEGLVLEKTVTFSSRSSDSDEFVHSNNSGKTLRVIDKRSI
ncbi:acyl-CoA reductase [Halobacteriovorax sp.]|uniref:acyl-CoA reductase n=1 Tax=Halobacteriovorax sp. TaxID=2020862 RepID=UPI00356A9D8E